MHKKPWALIAEKRADRIGRDAVTARLSSLNWGVLQELQYAYVADSVAAVRSAVEKTRNWPPWSIARQRESVQTLVHAAEMSVLPVLTEIQLQAELPRMQRSIDDYLPREDLRRAWVDECLGGRIKECSPHGGRVTDYERERLSSALSWAYYVNSLNRARLISFHRMLVWAAVALFAILVALSLVQVYVWPHVQIVCPSVCPTSGGGESRRGDVVIVAIFGVIGGALAAVRAIASARRAIDPYAIHAAQAFLKAMAGGVTAIVGVMLLSAASIKAQNSIQVLSFAIVFGYSEELVTHMISKREEALLKSAVPSVPEGERN
ncbi:hypothetical protein BX285_2392 [Streptomyces sp. 1114.5]|nr:hypothetical protein BX285_2392 [Streptomyces sp. 1114.5]